MTDPLNHGTKIENQGGLTISIFLPYRSYCEIEDACQRQGINFDKYFLSLHENKSKVNQVESSGKACPLEVQEIEKLREKVEKKIKKK